MNPELVLRPATEEDTGAVAEVMLAARAGAVETATMPPPVHPASDMVRHVREDILPHREVWVAEVDGDVVGVMAVDEQWLDDLYVTPDHAGQGVGSALLDLAKALRPDGFELWVFEVNAPARRFYERHGLVLLERTDGDGNEERAPDLRYGWRPGHTV